MVVLVQGEDEATIEVEKSLLNRIDVETVKVGNVVTIWEDITKIPFYIRAQSVEDDGESLIIEGETVDVSAALCGNDSYDLVLNTNTYCNADAVGVIDGEDEGYAARFVDSYGEIHPAALYCNPEYLYRINSETNDTIHASGEGISCATLTNSRAVDGNFVVVDLQSEQAMSRSEKSWSYSILYQKTINQKFPSDEQSQKAGYIDATLAVKASLGAKIYINTSWWGRLNEFQAAMIGSYEIAPTLTAKFVASTTFGDSSFKEMYSIPAFACTFWVGYVPIYVAVEPSLVRKVSAEVSGSLTLTLPFNFKGDFELGTRWRRDNGFDMINSFSHSETWPNFENSGFKAEAKVNANVGFYLKGAILLYKFIGPTVTVGPSLNITGTAALANDNLSVGLSSKVTIQGSIGGELKIFSFHLGQFDFPVDLWSMELFNWSWNVSLLDMLESQSVEYPYLVN